MKQRVKLTLLSLFVAQAFSAQAMTLADAYQLALQRDAQLASETAKLEASEQMPVQAKAQLLPQVTASIAARDEGYQLPPSAPYYPQARNFSERTNNRNIQLTQAIVNQQAWTSLAQAELKFDYAKLRQAGIVNDLGLRVAEAYLNALLAQENQKLSVKQVESTKKRLNQVKAALKHGYSTKVDKLGLEAELYDAKARVMSDEQQVVFYRQKLAGLIGEAPPKSFTMPKIDVDNFIQTLVFGQSWLDDVKESNPSVQMSKVATQVAEKEIDVRQSAFYPTVNAGISYNTAEGATYFAQKNEDRVLFLEMRMPLYQGGYDTSRVTEGRALLKSAQEDVRYAEVQAVEQAQEQLSNILANQKRVEALQQAIVSGQSYLASVEEGYRLGVRDITEVSRAKEKLFNNKRDMVRANIEVLNNVIQLYAVAGRLNAHAITQMSELLWRK